MNASGSGRTPANFSIAASTSSVAASPSGSSPVDSARAFFRFSPPVMYEKSWNSMSGAGDSDTLSVSTSRNVRPPMGKLAGAPRAAMTSLTRFGSFAGNNPKESPTLYSSGEPVRSNSTCQVSFSEGPLFSRVRERNVALAGLSRVPGAACGLGAGSAAFTTAGAATPGVFFISS